MQCSSVVSVVSRRRPGCGWPTAPARAVGELPRNQGRFESHSGHTESRPRSWQSPAPASPAPDMPASGFRIQTQGLFEGARSIIGWSRAKRTLPKHKMRLRCWQGVHSRLGRGQCVVEFPVHEVVDEPSRGRASSCSRIFLQNLCDQGGREAFGAISGHQPERSRSQLRRHHPPGSLANRSMPALALSYWLHRGVVIGQRQQSCGTWSDLLQTPSAALQPRLLRPAPR